MPFNPIYDENDFEFAKEVLTAALKEQSAAYMPWNEPDVSVSAESLPGDIRKISAYAKMDAPSLLANPGLSRIAARIANRGMMAALIDSLPFERVKDDLARMAAGELEDILPDSDDPLFDNVAAYCEKIAEEAGAISAWPEMLGSALTDGLPIEYGVYAEMTLSPWAAKDEEIVLTQGFVIDAPWFMRGESMEGGLRPQEEWLRGYLGEKARMRSRKSQVDLPAGSM